MQRALARGFVRDRKNTAPVSIQLRTCACANFSGRSWADADDTEDARDICAENSVPEQSQ